MSKEHIAKLTGTYKKGNLPHNNLPIGSIRNINKYIEIKYANHKWMSLAWYNWEQVHGAIPKGMCVFKLDGNAYNNDISNLCLITRKDLAQLNRKYNKIPQELKEVQILVNQIKQKTKWQFIVLVVICVTHLQKHVRQGDFSRVRFVRR